MSRQAYVLRRYSLNTGFTYFIGAWEPLACTRDGHWFITPKTCVELEKAMPFDSESRATEWVGTLNNNQRPKERPWHVAKVVLSGAAARSFSGMTRPLEHGLRDLREQLR